MCYAALNVLLACYAVKAFIGLRNSVVDVWILNRPQARSVIPRSWSTR
jgi:hypothetical protein